MLEAGNNDSGSDPTREPLRRPPEAVEAVRSLNRAQEREVPREKDVGPVERTSRKLRAVHPVSGHLGQGRLEFEA
jgi:hypothetical protein